MCNVCPGVLSSTGNRIKLKSWDNVDFDYLKKMRLSSAKLHMHDDFCRILIRTTSVQTGSK